jgi:hypothetical protein
VSCRFLRVLGHSAAGLVSVSVSSARKALGTMVGVRVIPAPPAGFGRTPGGRHARPVEVDGPSGTTAAPGLIVRAAFRAARRPY